MIGNSTRSFEALQKDMEDIITSINPMSEAQKNTIEEVIGLLDRGKLRVCTKEGEDWITHVWIKQTILLYFRQHQAKIMQAGQFNWLDKIPVKTWTPEKQVRAVPMAIARYGSFVNTGAILMPSFVNIGAYVDANTMVDTWATVGSCAQIGKNVHISGGVGIGGVLEPAQAQPVIIEDGVFLGSRCVVVEGVRVEEGAVLGAGTVITQSTKIINVTTPAPVIHRGVVPARSVVIPGYHEKQFTAGKYQVPCALIIGKRTPGTDLKTSLNQALREFEVPV